MVVNNKNNVSMHLKIWNHLRRHLKYLVGGSSFNQRCRSVAAPSNTSSFEVSGNHSIISLGWYHSANVNSATFPWTRVQTLPCRPFDIFNQAWVNLRQSVCLACDTRYMLLRPVRHNHHNQDWKVGVSLLSSLTEPQTRGKTMKWSTTRQVHSGLITSHLLLWPALTLFRFWAFTGSEMGLCGDHCVIVFETTHAHVLYWRPIPTPLTSNVWVPPIFMRLGLIIQNILNPEHGTYWNQISN